MSKRSGPPSRTPPLRRAVAGAAVPAPGGLASALAAFEALGAASAVDPELRGGRNALPRTETAARDRGLRILQSLDAAGVLRPERLAIVRLASTSRGAPAESFVWHVAPIYSVRVGKGPLLETVADPFLRHAPLGISEWMQQLQVDSVSFLFPDVLYAEHQEGAAQEASLVAPDTLKERRNTDVTTQRGGEGTEADGHGLAQLLRAWLRTPEEPPAQVTRFRSLFGDTAWRTLVGAYPKLIQQVEAELKRRGGR